MEVAFLDNVVVKLQGASLNRRRVTIVFRGSSGLGESNLQQIPSTSLLLALGMAQLRWQPPALRGVTLSRAIIFLVVRLLPCTMA